MLKTRLLSASVLLPVAFIAIYAGDWVFAALIIGFAVIAGWEYTHIANLAGHRVSVNIVWLHMAIWMYWAVGQRTQTLPLLLSATLLVSALWEMIAHNGAPSFREWLYVAGAGMYLGTTFGYLLLLRLQTDGLFWTMVSLPVIWVGDSAAYFVGRRFGKHKWVPKISPDKSWEGYIAQIVAGTLTGISFTQLMRMLVEAPDAMHPGWGALLGLLLSVFCPFGDLFISMIKREFQVKDTSHIIPGHGGVLDRLDALLWAGVITQAFISLLH